MIKQLNIALISLSALVLSACGGGGSSAAPASNISQSQASSAVGLAKNSNILFTGSIIDLSARGELLKLITISGGQTGGVLSAPSSSNCAVLGNLTLNYSKVSAGAGLSQGDQLIINYNNCVTANGQPTLSGNVVVTSTSTTTLDISNSASYSLPFSLALTNFRVASNGITTTYNGNINYSVFTIGTTGVGASSVTATTNNLASTTIISSGTINMSYENARFATVIPASGSPMVSSKFDLLTSTDTVPTPLSLTIENSLIGTISAPTSATHIVTNYLGGKITGSKATGSSTMSVFVDNGNNGTVDLSFISTY